MSQLLPTLMLLFDGKDKTEVTEAIAAYLKGKNATTWKLIGLLEKQLQMVTMISYSVSDLYDDIANKNDDGFFSEPLAVVCSDEIALEYIEGLRDYRKMEYAYDYFHEAKDAMIEDMINRNHIVPESLYEERNNIPYWGG